MLVATILKRGSLAINLRINGFIRSLEGRSATSVVAVDALHAFVLFLRMQAE